MSDDEKLEKDVDNSMATMKKSINLAGIVGTPLLAIANSGAGISAILLGCGGVAVILICGIIWSLISEKQEEEDNNFINKNKNLTNYIMEDLEKDVAGILLDDQNNKKIKQNISIKVFSNKKFNKILEKAKNKFIQKCGKEFKKTVSENFNVLLLGKTGVGKTTLINSFLELSDVERGKEGDGKPTPTIEFKEYKGERNNQHYTLFDTNGIQLKGENSIDNKIKGIINIINERNKQNDPNKYIHCIWYCATGSNIEPEEEKFIKKLIKIYTEKVTLPVFILHTKSINDEDSEKMKNRLSIILKEDYINYYYMDVIAREIKGKKLKFPSEGLPELEEKTKNEILTKGKK